MNPRNSTSHGFFNEKLPGEKLDTDRASVLQNAFHTRVMLAAVKMMNL